MFHKIIKSCSVLLLYSFSIQSGDVVSYDSVAGQSDDSRQLNQQQAQLAKQQEAEREQLYQQQAAEKNRIFTQNNAYFGTLDDQTVKNIRLAVDKFDEQSKQQDAALAKKHEQQQIALQQSMKGRTSSTDSLDSSGKTPKSPLSPKPTRSFREKLSGVIWSSKEKVIDTINSDPASFVQESILEQNLASLTDAERNDALNHWLKVSTKSIVTFQDKQNFYKNLSLLKTNLESLLPDNERLAIIVTDPVTKLATERTINYCSKQVTVNPTTISIGIRSTLQDLSQSKALANTNPFNGEILALNATLSNLKELAPRYSYVVTITLENFVDLDTNQMNLTENLTALTNYLKDLSNDDRATLLNHWIEYWKVRYSFDTQILQGETVLEGIAQDQIKTSLNFMRGVKKMIEAVNDILPKNQKLVLYVDSVGGKTKPANTQDLFHILELADKASPLVSTVDFVKEFNPGKFTFFIQ